MNNNPQAYPQAVENLGAAPARNVRFVRDVRFAWNVRLAPDVRFVSNELNVRNVRFVGLHVLSDPHVTMGTKKPELTIPRYESAAPLLRNRYHKSLDTSSSMWLYIGMNTQRIWTPVPTDQIPTDVVGILNREPDTAGVAVWDDAYGTTYVMGWAPSVPTLDGGASLPGQILSHLSKSDLPMPVGAWTVYTREGYQVVE